LSSAGMHRAYAPDRTNKTGPGKRPLPGPAGHTAMYWVMYWMTNGAKITRVPVGEIA
jgi:hypothetical protein